jgi:cold shock CspA family protein
MSSANVKSFNATKGCGFIQSDDGDGKAAFHQQRPRITHIGTNCVQRAHP